MNCVGEIRSFGTNICGVECWGASAAAAADLIWPKTPVETGTIQTREACWKAPAFVSATSAPTAG
jgi:hypothetical protein